jgi:hypothetical protein
MNTAMHDVGVLSASVGVSCVFDTDIQANSITLNPFSLAAQLCRSNRFMAFNLIHQRRFLNVFSLFDFFVFILTDVGRVV